jgi:serine-type D-Ala-D-Ala carboxypeptidase (penicillin-binding protein 5/6)
MKKITILVLLVLLFIPIKINAITVSARDAVLMDQDTGRILYGKNINDKRLIASITKIMTAIIAIESNKLDNTVKVGDEVFSSYGSNIYIEFNEQIKLIDLVYGLMLKSGNDAAMVIAKYIGGSEEKFVNMMNNQAEILGMTNTSFGNSHGLDEITQNYSTAYDMAKLMNYAMKNKTFKKIVGTKKYIAETNYKTYSWINKNKLLFSYKYATGGKTGYTEKAKKTLVTTATKNKLNLVVVTLDDGNQYESHKNLFEYGFSNYKKYVIVNEKNFKVVDDYFYRDKLYLKNSFYYPLTEVEKDNLTSKVLLKKIKNYKNNEVVGELTISLNNKIINKQNIYVKLDSKKESLISKFLKLFK